MARIQLITVGAMACFLLSGMSAFADKDKLGPEAGNEAAALCKELVEQQVPISENGTTFSTVGECMAMLRSVGVPTACHYLETTGMLEAVGLKNLGQCVKVFRDAQN